MFLQPYNGSDFSENRWVIDREEIKIKRNKQGV